MSEQVMEKAELKVTEETAAPERTVAVVTLEIRTLQHQAMQSAISYAIQIGMRLTEAKSMVQYGEWGNYVKELGYSQSTAQNLIRIFEEYGDDQLNLLGDPKSQTFGNLTYSKALALLAVPADEREEFVETHDVDGMSTRELQAAIKERDEARDKLDDVSRQLKNAETERDKMMSRAEMAEKATEETAQRLTKTMEELAELKNQPRDVAVEKVADQEAIDAAVQEALAGQQKELEDARKKLETAEKKAEKAEKAAAKAKAEAEEAGKGNDDALEEARREAEKAREEAERLKKELKLANVTVNTFRVHFEQWKSDYDTMEKDLGNIEKETADKLRAAVRAQMEAWGSEYGN